MKEKALDRKRYKDQTQEMLKEQITLREDTTALYRVTRTLAQLDDEQQMFELVLTEYLQRLNLRQGGVLLFENSREFGSPKALMIGGQLVEPDLRIPIVGNPSYDRLMETREPVVITDALHDELLASVRETVVKLGIKSLLLVPILVRDNVIGALGADALETTHEFTDREISLAKAMAGQLGIALENLWLHAETRRRAEQLAVLHELDRAITTSLRLDDVYYAFSRHANRLIPYDRLSITLLEGAKIRLVYVTGEIEGMPPVGSILPLNNSTVGRVVAQGQPLLLYDVLSDRQDVEDRPLVVDGVQSSMLIPLRVKREIIGTWNISSRQTGAYSPDDLDIAQSMADQLAIAIENARLYDEIQQHVNELTTLNKISQAVTSSLDLQETLTIITDHTIHSLGVMAASVALYDEANDDLWFAASSGGDANFVRDRRLPIDQGILGWVVQKGEPILVPDVSQDPHFFADFDQETGFITRSILCVPLQTKGQIIGAIEVMNKEEGTFTERDLELLTSLAAPAATAIENARLFERAQQELAERKRAEAALEEERALLARRVAERTADLRRANTELARAARLKDEFLASMSHELRTPLTAILGLSEVIREKVYGPLSDKQLKSINSIEASGRHLLALINDILDLSKIEAGKFELRIGPVSVERICQASLQFVKQAAQKKRLKITSTYDDKVKFIQADERRLKQIVVNLLSNAVKFTPAGGEIGLDVVGDPVNEVVLLTVWDTGIGVSPEDQSRLFQPFVQLDSRLSRQYAGTGLGLALVYRMVKMHHGSISLDSEVGQGSRFSISLPWRGEAETNRPFTDAGSAAPAKPDNLIFERALVIEDSPTSADQLVRYLKELDVKAVVHPHGDRVVAMAVENEPDIIILDIILPASSGWDVLAQLKSDPRTQPIPVLIVSVIDEPMRGTALGAADHLVKPISQQQLSQALNRISFRATHCPGSVVADSKPGPTSHAASAQPPLVLLAEDEDNVSKLLADYLIEHGYRIVTARNGIEALKQAKEVKPDIILMDIQMPELNGLEATRRIRADAKLSTTPIIALTALAMAGDRERCLDAGANEYLSKPVSLKELTNAIELQLNENHNRWEKRT